MMEYIRTSLTLENSFLIPIFLTTLVKNCVILITYPDLKFNSFIVSKDGFHFKVNANSADKGARKRVVGISEQERSLANATIADDQQFEHVVEILIGRIFLPLSVAALSHSLILFFFFLFISPFTSHFYHNILSVYFQSVVVYSLFRYYRLLILYWFLLNLKVKKKNFFCYYKILFYFFKYNDF